MNPAFVALATLLAMFAGGAKAGIPEPDLVWHGEVLASSGGATARLTAGTRNQFVQTYPCSGN